jgi:hypothetical protein
MQETLIEFQSLPWPPSEQCACGSSAAWQMILEGEKIPLCSECYQIETLRRADSRDNLLGDRIHRHWLVYRSDNPVHIRSDGVA